jgi:hypothetical protein
MPSLNFPHTLSNNTVADANHVMADLNAIRDFTNTEVVRTDGSVKASSSAIADSAITNAKIDYTTVPRLTVSTSAATGGKAGDVWIVV